MNSKKIKTWVIAANLLIVGLALPISVVSGWLNDSILTTPKFAPVRTVTSEQPLDLKVYDNFSANSDSKTFENLIIDHISHAQKKIIVAMYAFNIDAIKQALLAAQKRGVEVTIYTTTSNQDEFSIFWGDANQLIKPVYIGNNIDSTNYSMHHKFMLIDPGETTQSLLTGSWNWSYLQEDIDPNIVIETTNPQIIFAFSEEAQRLNNNYNGYNKFKLTDFHPWTDNINYPDGSNVEVWFSPGRERYSIQDRIIEMLHSAKKTIDIANTIIDSSSISDAIIQKAREGVAVRVIFDHLNLAPEVSIYQNLQRHKKTFQLDNLQLLIGGRDNANEAGQYSIFHLHDLIVDQQSVLTGTANWTFGGFFLNDENFLVINNPKIAQEFTKLFDNYLASQK